ncbi:isopenicillin N synthase family oxygenase [Agrobacterium vitis]|uniref:2-oxoglutarate-dependent ethylene/succinate-forming enzyme n=2 Tax=Agrobacterium vitis TaxID=373 RepID=A0ABD6GFR6_AGRVI|nr:2-oxoglutarate and iron-dependent oxygenase domain-containing protein [Agrobacterium vitis]MUO78778.1 isopenicillin N synthase family oxygenase [Agrobacterium vitis]MUO95019.1 isopenicillin N synthase family oxygenase [Agrobacterium vitis]MUP05189.1 isopenicillin N synthase family oxygenase [Agrobacterium vitis]MUZ81934.1 isopenicillin N synthase family oxygenase [Agrobacterium vitis]MVA09667.1 isopenicillin N synthase family oxygenase [Agrobacterium vitis]
MTMQSYSLAELNKETTIGGVGKTVEREVPVIDLADFDNRKAEIADQLWDASVGIGFFQVYNHGIPQQDIDAAFETAWSFFELPAEVKAQYPMPKGTNAGWEFKAQVRPSTGTPDNKESYQITRPMMGGLWPSEEELPDFKENMLRFERQNWELGMRILSCFALKMGFAEDFFTKAHDPASGEYQSTQRLIHYMSMEHAKPEDFEFWRAGAHSDFDCLTILHQKEGEGGLQVCPGKDAASGEWTDVPPKNGYITCNIGDMLMRWSDDQLQSTLHRVRMPRPGEYLGRRLSLPFFCQANRDAVMQGPLGKYEAITAGDYLTQRINANFARK